MQTIEQLSLEINTHENNIDFAKLMGQRRAINALYAHTAFLNKVIVLNQKLQLELQEMIAQQSKRPYDKTLNNKVQKKTDHLYVTNIYLTEFFTQPFTSSVRTREEIAPYYGGFCTGYSLFASTQSVALIPDQALVYARGITSNVQRIRDYYLTNIELLHYIANRVIDLIAELDAKGKHISSRELWHIAPRYMEQNLEKLLPSTVTDYKALDSTITIIAKTSTIKKSSQTRLLSTDKHTIALKN